MQKYGNYFESPSIFTFNFYAIIRFIPILFGKMNISA